MRRARRRGAAPASRPIAMRLAASVLLIGALGVWPPIAQAQGKPEPVPALLPDKTTIPPGEPMPIDGVWRIDSLGARVRIEGGRIYAVDPWIHLFVFKILPGQVVTKELARTGPGEYQGEDLPNSGLWRGTLNDNQQLEVVIKGKLAPIQVVLTALMPDSPVALRKERAEQIGVRSGATR